MKPISKKDEADRIGVIEADMQYWNTRDISGYLSHLTPDFLYRSVAIPDPLCGHEPIADFLRYTFETMPDWEVYGLSNICLNNNKASFTFGNRGSQINGFMGLPKMQQPYSFYISAINTFNSRNQKTETWAFWNVAELMMALGVVPNAYVNPSAVGGVGWSIAQTDRPNDLCSLISESLVLPIRILSMVLSEISPLPAPTPSNSK